MATRNFWLTADVDGYSHQLKGGPRSKDGGMKIELLARNNGERDVILDIYCYERESMLVVSATHDGREVFRWEAQRL